MLIYRRQIWHQQRRQRRKFHVVHERISKFFSFVQYFIAFFLQFLNYTFFFNTQTSIETNIQMVCSIIDDCLWDFFFQLISSYDDMFYFIYKKVNDVSKNITIFLK